MFMLVMNFSGCLMSHCLMSEFYLPVSCSVSLGNISAELPQFPSLPTRNITAVTKYASQEEKMFPNKFGNVSQV